MPNYVRSRLVVIGEQKRIDEMANAVRKTCKDGTTCHFDLDKIIPMPKTLDITSGTSTYDGIKYLSAIGKNKFLRSQEDLAIIEKFSKYEPEFRNKCIEEGRAAINNIADFGYMTWYEWRCANWGTKWNALETAHEDGSNTFEFETAWSAPLPCIAEISRQYPELSFIIEYADEDFAYNCGRIAFEAGEEKSAHIPEGGSREAWEVTFALWPEYRDDYELIDGNYKYIE